MNIVADQGVKHPSFYLGWEQRPCQFEDLELFFGPDEDEAAELPAARKAREERARAVCLGCSVRLRCLAWVLQFPEDEQYGVFGGMTAEERKREIRRRRAAAATAGEVAA